MKTRVVIPSVLCGLALLAVNPGAARSGGLDVAAEPPTEVLVQPEPDPLPGIIAQLHDPRWNQRLSQTDDWAERRKAYAELQGLLDRLGSFRGNPSATRELIQWLEVSPPLEFMLLPPHASFQDHLVHQSRVKRSGDIFVTEPTIPHPVKDYPAVRALLRMGPTVAPYLVDEYVTTFVGCKDPKLRLRHHRLLHIVCIVTPDDPKLAQLAVVYALGRMPDAPDDLTRQGYRQFIKEVVASFPADEREKLFPPEALRK